MRALGLLLLSVLLLAIVQASYIVAEAKKHETMRVSVEADSDAGQRWKKLHNKKQHHHKDGEEEEEMNDKVVKENSAVAEDKVVALPPMEDMMLGDQPETERNEQRAHLTNQERKSLRQQRKEQKRQRKDGVEPDDSVVANRKAGKRQQRQERIQKRKRAKQATRAEKNAEKKSEKKQKKQKKQQKQQKQQRSSCTSEDLCQEGECCVPTRKGDMICKPNRRPRSDGKKCVTSCTCGGELQCFVTNDPLESRGKRAKRRKLGRCTEVADPNKGYFLDAAYWTSRKP